jgi:hypothetical protein
MVVGKDNDCREYRRMSVYLVAVVVVVVCGGIRLGDQRWTDRRHGVYLGAGGEDQMVCPYSQQVRDLQLPRLFPVYHVTILLARRRQHSLLTFHPPKRLFTHRFLAWRVVLGQ